MEMLINFTGLPVEICGVGIASGGEGPSVQVPVLVQPNGQRISSPSEIPHPEEGKDYKIFIVPAEFAQFVPGDRADVTWPLNGVEKGGKICCQSLANHDKSQANRPGVAMLGAFVGV